MVMIGKMGQNGRLHNLDKPSHRWHKVFAWFPVYTIKGKKVWWKHVYKREFWYMPTYETSVADGVEYGDIFDVLSNPDEL